MFSTHPYYIYALVFPLLLYMLTLFPPIHPLNSLHIRYPHVRPVCCNTNFHFGTTSIAYALTNSTDIVVPPYEGSIADHYPPDIDSNDHAIHPTNPLLVTPKPKKRGARNPKTVATMDWDTVATSLARDVTINATNRAKAKKLQLAADKAEMHQLQRHQQQQTARLNASLPMDSSTSPAPTEVDISTCPPDNPNGVASMDLDIEAPAKDPPVAPTALDAAEGMFHGLHIAAPTSHTLPPETSHCTNEAATSPHPAVTHTVPNDHPRLSSLGMTSDDYQEVMQPPPTPTPPRQAKTPRKTPNPERFDSVKASSAPSSRKAWTIPPPPAATPSKPRAPVSMQTTRESLRHAAATALHETITTPIAANRSEAYTTATETGLPTPTTPHSSSSTIPPPPSNTAEYSYSGITPTSPTDANIASVDLLPTFCPGDPTILTDFHSIQRSLRLFLEPPSGLPTFSAIAAIFVDVRNKPLLATVEGIVRNTLLPGRTPSVELRDDILAAIAQWKSLCPALAGERNITHEKCLTAYQYIGWLLIRGAIQDLFDAADRECRIVTHNIYHILAHSFAVFTPEETEELFQTAKQRFSHNAHMWYGSFESEIIKACGRRLHVAARPLPRLDNLIRLSQIDAHECMQTLQFMLQDCINHAGHTPPARTPTVLHLHAPVPPIASTTRLAQDPPLHVPPQSGWSRAAINSQATDAIRAAARARLDAARLVASSRMLPTAHGLDQLERQLLEDAVCHNDTIQITDTLLLLKVPFPNQTARLIRSGRQKITDAQTNSLLNMVRHMELQLGFSSTKALAATQYSGEAGLIDYTYFRQNLNSLIYPPTSQDDGVGLICKLRRKVAVSVTPHYDDLGVITFPMVQRVHLIDLVNLHDTASYKPGLAILMSTTGSSREDLSNPVRCGNIDIMRGCPQPAPPISNGYPTCALLATTALCLIAEFGKHGVRINGTDISLMFGIGTVATNVAPIPEFFVRLVSHNIPAGVKLTEYDTTIQLKQKAIHTVLQCEHFIGPIPVLFNGLRGEFFSAARHAFDGFGALHDSKSPRVSRHPATTSPKASLIGGLRPNSDPRRILLDLVSIQCNRHMVQDIAVAVMLAAQTPAAPTVDAWTLCICYRIDSHCDALDVAVLSAHTVTGYPPDVTHSTCPGYDIQDLIMTARPPAALQLSLAEYQGPPVDFRCDSTYETLNPTTSTAPSRLSSTTLSPTASFSPVTTISDTPAPAATLQDNLLRMQKEVHDVKQLVAAQAMMMHNAQVAQLQNALDDRLLALHDATAMYPGSGDDGTPHPVVVRAQLLANRAEDALAVLTQATALLQKQCARITAAPDSMSFYTPEQLPQCRKQT